MTSIFLSYRRADTAGHAGRLVADLRKRFGENSVFHDIEIIPAGADFIEAIDEAIRHCQVLLILIGNTWLDEQDGEGRRRLGDPHDFVRLEIATALRRGIKVLPVLVEGAVMPKPDELPADLAALSHRNALELSDTRWDYDVGRLLAGIESLTGKRRSPGRKTWLAAALSALLLMSGVGYYYLTQPADVSGRWQLPDGNYWIVTQNGKRIGIQEVHHDSKQVWKRGRGVVQRKRIRFRLDLVFDRGHYEGQLQLGNDGVTMSGNVISQRFGREPLILTR
jgi:hypothetical protein